MVAIPGKGAPIDSEPVPGRSIRRQIGSYVFRPVALKDISGRLVTRG